MCANSEGSGEAAQMHRLVWAFTGRLCDKYHNLMSCLKYEKHSDTWTNWTTSHENVSKMLKYISMIKEKDKKQYYRN